MNDSETDSAVEATSEKISDDVRTLHALGYGQELLRRMSGFSNFAMSLSIICIVAGGITSFHLAVCSVGGAAIGVGWPLGSLMHKISWVTSTEMGGRPGFFWRFSLKSLLAAVQFGGIF